MQMLNCSVGLKVIAIALLFSGTRRLICSTARVRGLSRQKEEEEEEGFGKSF